METIRKQFVKELKNLDISEEEEISARIVTKKFKRKALLVHSDKTRNGDDEAFVELLDDYKKVIDAIEKSSENNEKLDVKTDIQEFFEKHNIIKEFSQSWTILIEKEKVESWNKEMLKRFPEPKFLQGHGTQYKSSMEEGNVFITLYDVTVPKMNIQGNQKCIRKFVIDVMPELYREVSEGAQIETQRSNLLPLNTRVKLSAETTYSCDVCAKKYIRKPALRKHIQIKHASSVDTSRTAVCIATTAIPLPLIDSTQESNKSLTLEECAEVVEEIGPQQMYTNWQCSECGKIFIIENQLVEHMTSDHKDDIWQCDECGNTFKEESQLTVHVSETHRVEVAPRNDVNFEKKYELLERRHVALKEKYEEVMKKNREYAKDIFKYIEENTELKNNAEKDAEILADTLSINQVLTEEIKVKDQIIKANEIINNNAVNQEEMDVVVVDDETMNDRNRSEEVAKCKKCDWTSPIVSHLKGHMIKHTGQYVCDVCKNTFKTNGEMKNHKQIHEEEQVQLRLVCITCDKLFQTEHSFKQHMQAKHKEKENSRVSRGNILPVGHPERYIGKQENKLEIACTKCKKLFASGREIEEHMKEHIDENKEDEGFQYSRKEKSCVYYRRGFCAKGELCAFNHNIHQTYRIPACKKGEKCEFLYQNRCKFFHEGVGVQRPRFGQQERPQKKECKFQEECWNFSSCTYLHKDQDFHLAKQTNRPPQGMRNLRTWINF